MSDGADIDAGNSAGGLLRAAREKQGLHIAALAAAIKVAPRKLDALENNRFDELPDATFTRALAQTVCRTLKIDPQPVLALLPPADATALDHVSGTLNEPFRERPGRSGEATTMAVAAIRPMAWAGLVLLVAAIAVYFLPAGLFMPSPEVAPVPAVVASAPEAVASAAVAVAAPASDAASAAEAVASAASAAVAAVVAAPVPAPAPVAVAPAPTPPPPPAVAVATPAPAAPGGASPLQLRVDAASWIEVRDARGTVLLSRTVVPGETVGLDGALPIRLTIGNAPATRVSFRGKPVDLAAATRDSVARLELQ